MSIVVNAYCTRTDVEPPPFPHELKGRRDRADPALAEHLRGFVGFVLQGGRRPMTQTLYHVMRHIQRVQDQWSFVIEEGALEQLAPWAERANAILFFPDGSVREPSGRVLVDPESGEGEDGADVPYPDDALRRREATVERLRERGVRTPAGLPAVVGAAEVTWRTGEEAARRALALFITALRAESVANGEPIPAREIEARMPLAFGELSPAERAFLENEAPSRQEVTNFTWGYEALGLLAWALGVFEELPFPDRIVEVPRLARAFMSLDPAAWVASARLRAPNELLDALDLHLRLHWATRDAGQKGSEPPAGIEPGVVAERHRALNWLVRFEDAGWDDVDTPT
jgi:Domain of unknown function (DUF4272)